MNDTLITQTLNGLTDNINLWINIYSIVISVIGLFKLTQWFLFLYKKRYLRKVWGFKDKETVIVICSELDDPSTRQNIDPREFYYHFKYGDLDAYIEVILTLLRLYPKIKLKVLSSGEAVSSRIDMTQHMVLIGGPDFNNLSMKILSKNVTQFDYLAPHLENKSKSHFSEISLLHKPTSKEYCRTVPEADFGYFEKINNPMNKNKLVVLLGGCHSMGVTSAVKAFSLLNNEHDEISPIVLKNSKKIAKKIKSYKTEFCVLTETERIGQSLNTPMINIENVWIKND